MAKFKESELTENLKGFQNNTTIELEFEKSIDGKIKLQEANIKYDHKRGYINIESRESNFKINTTLVYGYEKIEDEIHIDLESILLRIKKVN